MLLQKHSTHEEIRESVKVNYWVGSHNPAQTSSGSMIELWTGDGFEWFFAVNFLYPKFAVLARSKQLILMPVTVKSRSDFLVCCLQSHLLLQKSPTFPCKQGHEAMKNCRDSLPEAWGPWEPQYAPPALQYPEKQRVWSRTCGLKNCCNTVIVLSVVLWDCCKPTNKCWDSAFSLCGLEVGLPGLQQPSFAKCDALPKGDLFDIFVKGNPIPTRRLRSLRAAARSISSAWWLHHACKR